MSPWQELERLCQARGLPVAVATRLLPLVEQSRRATPAVRERLLALVEGALDAEQAQAEEAEKLKVRLDEGCLALVAKLLHRWGG